MGWLEILSIVLGALLPVIVKWFPEPKSKEREVRDALSSHQKAVDRFRQTGDTSDLGQLPD